MYRELELVYAYQEKPLERNTEEHLNVNIN